MNAPATRLYSPGFNAGGRTFRAHAPVEGSPVASWQLVNNAWSKMPAATSLSAWAITEGMTPDECLAHQAGLLAQFGDVLRGLFARYAEDTAELARFRQQLDAEIDRADMIAARRAARESKT